MSSRTETDPAFEGLLRFLRENRGFDFTGYKRPSLTRRVRKRMAEVGVEEFEAYQDYLQVHPNEFAELFNTILINVTSFFRDAEAWDYLADEIVPRILKAKTPNSTIRMWSAGCASGEEAYSLVMMMAEAMGMEACRRHLKIYATDVDEEDLERARRGSYKAEALEPIPLEIREKYFERSNSNGRYVFRRDLRRTLVFGRHDLMHDAPISRLDLLLCRNTLIYFNREAQDRIVARFHFALKDDGYIFLGRAETMLVHEQLFEPVAMEHRVFCKADRSKPEERMEALVQAGMEIGSDQSEADPGLQGAALEAMPLAQIVVDRRERLALANEQARSRLGLDLRDLHRPFRDMELSYRPLELRSLIEEVRERKESIVVRDVERTLAEEDGEEYWDIVVTPLYGSGDGWLGTAITFWDVTERRDRKVELEQAHHELETTYEELQSTNEELETSNEELQSTVEELQTTNEELQSSNEEMETMNEELQSANAELQEMNEELRSRTSDLDRAYAFQESILASVDVGIVAVDREFKITLWNDRAEDLWGLRSGEVQDLSLFDLDIGLPVEELEGPIRRFLAGEAGEKQEIVLEATNRRGRTISCTVSQTIRSGSDGQAEGIILLMNEE
jgi:two-component system CheB/CheR fusion protein